MITVSEKYTISEIASFIEKDWKNVNFAARPYLDAMTEIRSIDDNYGFDSARSVISYFIVNATSYNSRSSNGILDPKQVKEYLKKEVAKR